jgi:hypothetical protein
MNLDTVYISTKFRPDRTQILPELITFSLSIITFSLSRTTVEACHVATGEHSVAYWGWLEEGSFR